MKPRTRPRRDRERGSAMLVTLILISALLAGGAALASMQLKGTRAADVTRTSISALYCAEAGVVAVRALVASSYAQWNGSLGTNTEPAWLAAVNRDVDGDSAADFRITLYDNEDETPNDPARDNDLSIYAVSTCIKYPEVPVQVKELVRFNGGGHCYQAQLGGCGGNNNAN